MQLPFTVDAFLGAFADYHRALWPAPVVLTLLALALLVPALRPSPNGGRVVAFGLALLWAWLAVAYHLAFFWAINPAAPLLAAISLATAGAFAWWGGAWPGDAAAAAPRPGGGLMPVRGPRPPLPTMPLARHLGARPTLR